MDALTVFQLFTQHSVSKAHHPILRTSTHQLEGLLHRNLP